MLQVIRIDDRLIHGQVIVGWRSKRHFDKIIVCDGEISQEAWEQEILSSVCPEDITVEFVDEVQLMDKFKAIVDDSDETMILIGKIAVMEKLAEMNLDWFEINIGGIHYESGRDKITPFLYLNDNEKQSFKKMMAKGYRFIVQDLPDNTSYELEQLLQ